MGESWGQLKTAVWEEHAMHATGNQRRCPTWTAGASRPCTPPGSRTEASSAAAALAPPRIPAAARPPPSRLRGAFTADPAREPLPG